MNSTQEREAKKILIERIVRLNGAPADVQQLLRKSVSELESTLEDAIAKASEAQIKAETKAEIDAMREASKKDHAWTHCLISTELNGRRLCDSEANRGLLEDLIGYDEPSAAAYRTIVLQFPNRFSWETPKIQTDAEREAEFAKTCRENYLSECDANRELHKKGVSLDAWAGASALERAKFQNEAAQARQHRLIHSTPTELKAEAAYEWQTTHDEAVRAEADRRQQYVLSQQQHYPPLPTTTADGTALDARYLRGISTTDFPLFKRIVRKYGSGNVTARLRGE